MATTEQPPGPIPLPEPPEAMEPTPSEWVDRFLAQPRHRQEQIAQRILDSSEKASRCWMEDHEWAVRQLRKLSGELYEATFEALKSAVDSKWRP